ncbi:hypothetical protein AB0L44_39960 [Nonomuraea wenchangensis]|uniref:hypothetical protein n=1 Tax=Nonomuraea wenchangensis TaxID=568860 RepID=UPI0034305B64
MLVGYGRVSTHDQNLARQEAPLVLLAEPDRSLSAIAKLLKVSRHRPLQGAARTAHI